MSIKEFTLGTVKVALLGLAKLFWAHAPEIIQFCTLVYAVGLAVQTCYRFLLWARRKIAAYRARPAV